MSLLHARRCNPCVHWLLATSIRSVQNSIQCAVQKVHRRTRLQYGSHQSIASARPVCQPSRRAPIDQGHRRSGKQHAHASTLCNHPLERRSSTWHPCRVDDIDIVLLQHGIPTSNRTHNQPLEASFQQLLDSVGSHHADLVSRLVRQHMRIFGADYADLAMQAIVVLLQDLVTQAHAEISYCMDPPVRWLQQEAVAIHAVYEAERTRVVVGRSRCNARMHRHRSGSTPGSSHGTRRPSRNRLPTRFLLPLVELDAFKSSIPIRTFRTRDRTRSTSFVAPAREDASRPCRPKASPRAQPRPRFEVGMSRSIKKRYRARLPNVDESILLATRRRAVRTVRTF